MAKKSKEDWKKEGVAVKALFASAKKKEHNCAVVICAEGLAIEADPRLPAKNLKKKAKKRVGATPKGVMGKLKVNGTNIEITCLEEPPGGMETKFKQYLTKIGVKMKPILIVPQSEEAPVDEDARPEEVAVEEDAESDIGEILQKARKKPHNAAWLLGDKGLVLKAHPRHPIEKLRQQAKSDGGGPRGACGMMTVSGKTVTLTCQEEPPKSFPRLAKVWMADQGYAYKVKVVLPDGSEIDSDEDAAPVGEGQELSKDALAADLKHVAAVFRLRFNGMAPDEVKALKGALKGVAVSIAGGNLVAAQNALNKIALLTGVTADTPVEPALAKDQPAEAGDVGDQKTAFTKRLAVMKPQLSRYLAVAKPIHVEDVQALVKTFGLAMKLGDMTRSESLLSELGTLIEPGRAQLVAFPAPGDEPVSETTFLKFAAAEPEAASLESRASAKASPGAKPDEPRRPRVKGRKIPCVVKVTKPMSNLEFSILVDMVAAGMTRQEAIENNKNPANRVTPLEFEITEKEIKKGYVVVNYFHPGLSDQSADALEQAKEDFDAMDGAQQNSVNQEADALFWEMTEYKRGEPLDPSDPNFKAISEQWLKIRADVVQQQQRVDRIPAKALRFLKFGQGGIPITAENIDRLVEVSKKVEHLSDEAMADFWNRVDGKADTMEDFAGSVERYLEKLEKRQAATETRMDAQKTLSGKRDLYKLYKKANRGTKPESTSRGRDADFNIANKKYNAETLAAQKKLAIELHKWGYASEEEFKNDIKTFKKAVQNEAVLIADEAMDRRMNDLYEFETSAMSEKGLEDMLATLAKVREKRDRMADEIKYQKTDIDPIDQRSIPDLVPDWEKIQRDLKPEIMAAIESDENLRRLYELLKAENPKKDLDDEILRIMVRSNNPGDLHKKLERMLEKRRDGIKETRQLLMGPPPEDAEPEEIWKFDAAMGRAMAEAQVDPDSVHNDILQDHMGAIQRREILGKLALGAAAIVAGLLTFGQGTVAVLGGAAAVGLGTADAWDTYVTYQQEDAANKAGLSTTDPSFVWVVVAIAAIPLDVLDVASGLKTFGKAASKSAHIAKILEDGSDVAKAVTAFNKAQETVESTEDVAAALAKLEKDLAKADKAVSKAILRAAEAEAAANAAWTVARKSYGGRAMSVIDPLTPLIDWAWHFAYPVCLSMRKGILQFDAFMKTNHAKALVGKIADLKPQAIENLKKAHSLGVEDWKTVSKRAKELNLSEDQFDDAFKVWGRTPDMRTDDFIKKVLEPMAADPKAAAVRLDLFTDATDKQLSAVIKAAPKKSKTSKQLVEIRKEIRKARKAFENGEIDSKALGEARTRLAGELENVMKSDPIVDEVMNLSDDLFTIADPKKRKAATDQIDEAISGAYEDGGTILDDFAARQQQARADGQIEQSIFAQEVGERLSRSGEWQGTPGDSPWSPKDPEMIKKTYNHYLDLIEKNPNLKISVDDVTHIPHKDGYPDFSKYVDGGWEPDSPGRAMIKEKDFFPEGIDPQAKKLTTAEEDKMRKHHDRLADTEYAKKKGWFRKNGKPDNRRVAKFRKKAELTWHHVENSTELQLVPQWLHGKVGHKGGFATRGGL